MEALYGLLDDAGDDAEGNITLFINMRHHKGYLILFPDCPAVIAGVGNGIDTDGEPDKDGAFMDVFHSSGVFSLNLTFFHVFLAQKARPAYAAFGAGKYKRRLLSQYSLPFANHCGDDVAD